MKQTISPQQLENAYDTYVKIFRKDCRLIVRNEAASLFDPQDGQVAALHRSHTKGITNPVAVHKDQQADPDENTAFKKTVGYRWELCG